MAVMTLIAAPRLLAGDSAKIITSSKNLLDDWNSAQHLYVKGNIRIEDRSLNQLEKWLDRNGKNWTVVLVQSAKGERWQDARGVNYYGMDAVENALGRGLGNKATFLDLKDPRTGQANGAVFVLFLSERKFSYFGSEVADRRGLGESAWAGNLDGPARNAMRNGGRIIDAVKNTVTHVEGKLTRRLAYEKRLQEEAVERRERLLRMTQREMVDVKRQLDELENEVGKFRALATVRSGDLASPPLPEWQRDLDSASDALKAGHVGTASSAVKMVRRNVGNHHDLLQDWYQDREKLVALQQRIDQVHLVDENPGGAGVLGMVRRLQTMSQAKHSAGDSSYAARLVEAVHALNRLESENQFAIVAKKQNDRRERERREKVRKLTNIGGSVAVLGVCLVGVGTNRRRRKNKNHAEGVLAHWQVMMKDRFDRLFQVMDRAGVVVGSEKDLPERGYEGETLRESINAIRAVDKAFILSSGVDDVLEQVEKLVHPNWVGPKFVNLFSRARYERAIELLERKPVVTGSGEIKVADRSVESLLGLHARANSKAAGLTKPLSFSELIREFDLTLNTADAALDRVDEAWETISERSGALNLSLKKVVKHEGDIRSALLSDGWLAAGKLFSVWHPAARKLQQQGIELGKHDPVAALDHSAGSIGPIPLAETMTSEMLFCLDTLKLFRSGKLPAIREHMKSLRRIGRKSDWVVEAMDLAGSDLDAMAGEGATRSVQAECELFRDGLNALSERVAHAVDLSTQAKSELPKMSESLRRSVDNVRGELSRKLSLSRTDILTERDEWNPDKLLEEYAGLKTTAENGLDHGAVELAFDALQSARAALSLAEKLVNETLTAHGEFQSRHSNAQRLADDAKQLKQEGSEVLEELRNKYSESALYYEPGTDSGETFASAGKTMELSVGVIGDAIDLAGQEFAVGRILTARNHLIESEENHQLILLLHDDLLQRKKELSELGESNIIRMSDALTSLNGMSDAMNDPRVCSDTVDAFAQLEAVARDTKRAVDAPYGESNPYRSELALDELSARLVAMETRIESDREAFAGADQMLAAADSSAADASRIVGVSRSDGIPDSTATRDYVQQIETCSQELAECRRVLNTAHSAWRELMKRINSQHTRLGEAMAGLKKELRRARLAVDSIRAARITVNRAVMWSGSYGVRITGSPGALYVQKAHELLSQGRYEDASRTAAFARTQARQAIASAEVKEAGIRRRREAEARRRRAASSRLSSSSGSSSFGRSSSFGSSSSSSGFSSSSFSSGSGFSRSGW